MSYRDFREEDEKRDEVRMVIKWIFYLTIGIAIYISLKFINEREITLPQVGEDLTDTTVKVTAKAIEDGAVVGKDVMEKSTFATKDLVAKGLAVTKQIIVKNIETKNSPQKARPVVQQPVKPAPQLIEKEVIEDDEDAEIEERSYNYPLF